MKEWKKSDLAWVLFLCIFAGKINHMSRSFFLISLSSLILFACAKDEDVVPGSAESAAPKSIQTTQLITSPANYYTNLFNLSGGGWTGGDGAYSIPLPDGRILWTFGDSFLGTVNPDYSRPGSPLYNNIFVVQDGNELTTLAGGTPQNPTAYVLPIGNPNHWYWPGDGTVIGNKLYVFMLRLKSNGSGGVFGFEHIGTDMAVFSLPDLQLIEQYPIVRTTKILWGVSIYEEEGYIYTYGTRVTFGRMALAARMAISNPGELEFWNGTTWTSNLDATAYLEGPNGTDVHVSNQFSVFKRGSKYHLMTQDDFLGTGLKLYTSDSPVGPWLNPINFYNTPETGGDIWTYNAFAHPHIEHPTKGMLVTYSVNSFNFGDIFEDARNYRPRFIWVKEAE